MERKLNRGPEAQLRSSSEAPEKQSAAQDKICSRRSFYPRGSQPAARGVCCCYLANYRGICQWIAAKASSHSLEKSTCLLVLRFEWGAGRAEFDTSWRYRLRLSFYRRLSIREHSVLAKLSLGRQQLNEQGRLAFCDRSKPKSARRCSRL